MTDAWQNHGIDENHEYAILTDEIYKGWSDLTAKEYKQLKGLTKENLRENMTRTEQVLSSLAETVTLDLINSNNPQGLEDNKKIARDGAGVARNARKETEKLLGKSAVTSDNAENNNTIRN